MRDHKDVAPKLKLCPVFMCHVDKFFCGPLAYSHWEILAQTIDLDFLKWPEEHYGRCPKTHASCMFRDLLEIEVGRRQGVLTGCENIVAYYLRVASLSRQGARISTYRVFYETGSVSLE